MPAWVKYTVILAAVVGIVSTPLVWLLNGPDTGQMVGAVVQAATGVAALVWAVMQQPQTASEQSAIDTGDARATGGGDANTGKRRSGATGGGPARAERTGNATANGPGSRANTGIDNS
ncbi:hypothetical protein ABZ023_09695 [Streptomyces sp. NPDC006367]|uniref:hypothetical protein n=1 Tax=unclassified Streptomyces TaxID=2593676 RepID=UPI0033A9FAB4